MKVLSAETNLSSATNVGSASVVRIFNSDSSTATITKKDSGGSTIGTFTVGAGEVIYCEKNYTDTLEGGATLKVSKTAYSSMMSYSSYSSGGGGGGGDNVVTDNMVVYLDAGNNSSYSGSGTSWNDISGNSNNFTLTNGPTYSSSDGGSIVFDGANDFATSAINASFFAFGTGDYSYGVWAKMDSTGNTESLLSCGTPDGGGTPNSFQLDFEGANTRIRHLFRDASSQRNFLPLGADDAVALVGTDWFYVMVVNDRSENELKMYINSTVLTTGDSNSTYGTGTDVHNFSAASDSNGTFKIGVNRGGSAFIDGRVAQVHIYKGKALTASEVLQNYNASKSRYGL